VVTVRSRASATSAFFIEAAQWQNPCRARHHAP
jgi:hypothetical protein